MTEETATTPVAEEADVAESSNEVANDAANTDTNQDNAPEPDVEGDDADDQAGESADDLENVEWEGKSVRVPPEVKAALMRTADYTRKTQAVAETQRQLEARETELTQRAEALATTIEERAELKAVQQQLAAFDKLSDEDWDALEDEDPKQARKLQRQRSALKERAGTLHDTLQTKEREALEAERTTFATRVQESQAVLARDIKGWGPQLAAQITAVGKDLGFSGQELFKFNADPRIIKAFHEIALGKAALKREAAANKVQSAQQTKPERNVGGASPHARKTTDATGDGLSTAEWMRREDARLAAKRKTG